VSFHCFWHVRCRGTRRLAASPPSRRCYVQRQRLAEFLAASSVLDFRGCGENHSIPKVLEVNLDADLAWVSLMVSANEMGAASRSGLTVISLPFGSLLGFFYWAHSTEAPTREAPSSACFAGLANHSMCLPIYQTWLYVYFMIGAASPSRLVSMISRIKPDAQHDNAAQKRKMWQRRILTASLRRSGRRLSAAHTPGDKSSHLIGTGHFSQRPG